MKLIELKPEWVGKSEKEPNEKVERYIDFNCPTCPDNECGGLMIPLGENGSKVWGWNREEDFEKLTITPSIWHHCKSNPHFFITNGEIIFA